MSARAIAVGLAAASALAAAACLESPAVVCADGVICPPGTVCAEGERRCVSPEELQSCTGKGDGDACSHPGLADGACSGGLCIPAGCGNGVVEAHRGEVCDDGNQVSGDGCSADCLSDETCGNGIVDAAAGEECDDGDLLSGDGCSSTCLFETPRWKDISPRSPKPSQIGFDYAIAFDVQRGRVVMFNAASIGERRETWEWDGRGWIDVTPATGAPGPRLLHSMAYDGHRGRVVLFGGAQDPLTQLGDTWEWDGASWTEVTPATQSPPRRAEHAMTYDAARRRVVLFGGNDFFSGRLNDTWEWDGASWVEVTPPSGPPARSGHGLAYDPARGRVVLFGGFGGASDPGPLADTWEWDGTAWSEITPTLAPSPRSSPAMAYDAGRGRVVLFGGSGDLGASFEDTWEWDGTAWSEVTPPSQSPPGGSSRMAWDVWRGRAVLLRAASPGETATWEWDGAAWTDVTPTLESPSERMGHSMAFDALRNQVVLFGGVQHFDLDEPPFKGDTWLWNGVSWTEVSVSTSPSARSDQAMAYDAWRGRVVLFGGRFNGSRLGDTWEWDGKAWSEVTPATGSPPARSSSAMAYDPVRRRVVLTGGHGDAGGAPTALVLDDAWEWDGASWTMASPIPEPRAFHGLAYDAARDRLVMSDGDSTWESDGSTWMDLTAGSGPPPMSGHAMGYHGARRRVTVVDQGAANLAGLWEWDGAVWNEISTGVFSPSGRHAHAMIHDAARGRLVLFGGAANPVEVLSDTWGFDYRAAGSPREACLFGFDTDGDGLVGCDDPDCWGTCTPLCPPGAPCDPEAPRCGDGVCNPHLETCRLCPEDCGACQPICGDLHCDPGEDADSCPGDCAG